MPNNNTSKRVLITGCSSGFGLLTAVQASKAGFQCIATMRNLAKAGPLRSALKLAKTDAIIEKLDITDPADIENIVAKYAPIDILINNSGILTMGSFLDISPKEAKNVFETNYFGAVALTQAVTPAMIESKQGLIINVASLAGIVGHMFNAAYAASKHALIGFSRSIRMELKPFNIKVVSIEPGYHKTEIIRTNATLCENFYNRQSPMFEQNRGFLRLMFDEVIPKAGEPKAVSDKIIKIMLSKNPKPHYIIGKDAKLATLAMKLGLGKMLEKKVCEKIATSTRREIRRVHGRRQSRKKR
jgi:NAD(P)-dependent dehydrogenase (short-subunit alcohol dehydrogenase family)